MVKKQAFKEIEINENLVIRKFSKNTEDSEMKWHFDLEDRIIIPLNENSWQLQIDNKLPFLIENTFKIKSNIWHRLIKGDSDLYLLIFKGR